MSIDDLFNLVAFLSKRKLGIDFAKKLKSIVTKIYRSILNDFNTANFNIALAFDRVKLLNSQIKRIDKQLENFFNRINTTLILSQVFLLFYLFLLFLKLLILIIFLQIPNFLLTQGYVGI
ncbi:hypothetical protein OSSY52_19370 [Tepiditoga spiralis]|uniref:Uncharacterized protein n=1 Tax=Tepiditoga spiralis TaxID=2108365 RepID=A0A7G1G8P0_9BACT|nr:hypothetical protein OSSY52_19370 [Tepiditoga spiralis]